MLDTFRPKFKVGAHQQLWLPGEKTHSLNACQIYALNFLYMQAPEPNHIFHSMLKSFFCNFKNIQSIQVGQTQLGSQTFSLDLDHHTTCIAGIASSCRFSSEGGQAQLLLQKSSQKEHLQCSSRQSSSQVCIVAV